MLCDCLQAGGRFYAYEVVYACAPKRTIPLSKFTGRRKIVISKDNSNMALIDNYLAIISPISYSEFPAFSFQTE